MLPTFVAARCSYRANTLAMAISSISPASMTQKHWPLKKFAGNVGCQAASKRPPPEKKHIDTAKLQNLTPVWASSLFGFARKVPDQLEDLNVLLLSNITSHRLSSTRVARLCDLYIVFTCPYNGSSLAPQQPSTLYLRSRGLRTTRTTTCIDCALKHLPVSDFHTKWKAGGTTTKAGEPFPPAELFQEASGEAHSEAHGPGEPNLPGDSACVIVRK